MSVTESIQHSGLSRRAICDRAGLSLSMLSMIESGARRASPETAVALAEVLNVAPAVIRPDLAVFAPAGNVGRITNTPNATTSRPAASGQAADLVNGSGEAA